MWNWYQFVQNLVATLIGFAGTFVVVWVFFFKRLLEAKNAEISLLKTERDQLKGLAAPEMYSKIRDTSEKLKHAVAQQEDLEHKYNQAQAEMVAQQDGIAAAALEGVGAIQIVLNGIAEETFRTGQLVSVGWVMVRLDECQKRLSQIVQSVVKHERPAFVLLREAKESQARLMEIATKLSQTRSKRTP